MDDLIDAMADMKQEDDIFSTLSVRRQPSTKSLLNFNYHENKIDEDKLSLLRKVFYGMGGLPIQLASNCLSFFLSIFLLEVAHLNPFNLIFVSLFARVWDAVTDLPAGAFITHFHHRVRSFKPYMLLSLPIFTISFFFIFYNVGLENQLLKLLYYMLVILVFQTGTTLYFIPYGSLYMVLTSCARERDKLTAYRIVFEILGMLCASGLFGGFVVAYRPAFYCLNNTVTMGEKVKQQEKGYMLASGISICVIIICVLSTVFGSVEQYQLRDKYKFSWSFCKKVFCFKPYVLLTATFGCTSTGLMFIQANMALYVTHVLLIPKSLAGGIVTAMAFSILLIPVASKLISKFGKKTVYFSGIISAVPAFITLFFLPQKINQILYYTFMIYTSYPVMVSFLLPWSMLPDCLEYFVTLHSIRNEAAFISFFVFLQKFALGISVAMTGVVLGFAKYDSTICLQPKSVEVSLRYLVTFASTICFIGAFVCLFFYPINEAKRMEIKIKLIEMRYKKVMEDKEVDT